MGKQQFKRQAHLLQASPALLDASAQKEGPQRKVWHRQDLLSVTARNSRQRAALEAHARGQHLALLGTAGTGKSFLALLMACMDLTNPDADIDRVMICRSAVQGRDQGYLPGTLAEKMEPYALPYRELIDELFPKYTRNYDNMIDAGRLVFESTSFLRGRTLHRTALVVDEIQNFNAEEISTVITRGAPRVYLTGDTAQIDLNQRYEESGLYALRRQMAYMPSITAITFETQDIIRKGLTREYIEACEAVARQDAMARAQPNPVKQPQPVARAA